MAFAISSGHSQLRILFQRGLIVCKTSIGLISMRMNLPKANGNKSVTRAN